MTAEAVKEARRHLGLTQTELAKALDMSRSAVAEWERAGCDKRTGLALGALLWVRGHAETAKAFIWRQTDFPGFPGNDRHERVG